MCWKTLSSASWKVLRVSVPSNHKLILCHNFLLDDIPTIFILLLCWDFNHLLLALCIILLCRVLRDSSQYPLNDPNGANFRNYDWILVLPPWSQTLHWRRQSSSVYRAQPWSAFFNVESLNLFIPVIEFDEFLQMGKVSRFLKAVLNT